MVKNKKGILKLLILSAYLVFIFAASIIASAASNMTFANGTQIPDIYDDFSDGKYKNRSATDPWGRQLPEWTIESGTINASNYYVNATSFKTYHAILSTPINITKGTWIFKYKYINGTPNFTGNYYLIGVQAQYLNPIGTKTGYDSLATGLYLNNPVDGHWWIGSGYVKPRVYHSGYIINMVGSQINKSLVGGDNWHEITFIKDEDGYVYTWLDGEFVRWSSDKIDNENIQNSTRFLIDLYDCTDNQLQYPIAVDDIKIYKDQYISPNNNISYDSNLDSIVIDDFNTNLSKVAEAVNNSSVFSYEPLNNTATSHKNIIIKPGSKLKITNGTLLMDSSYAGERKIKYYTDTGFIIINSTISSTNDYYFMWERINSPSTSLKTNFRVENSTINNTGGIYLERPITLDIENSKFTNLVGNHPIQVYFRWPLKELNIKESIFQGKTGAERIYISGGDQFNELSPKPVGIDIIDCDFSQTVLERVQDSPYYLSPKYPTGTANVINTKLGNITYSGTTLRHKYYMDVKVVDSSGNPVSNVTVNVVNEKDNINHSVENLIQGKNYYQVGKQLSSTGDAYFSGQQDNWFQGWANNNDHNTTFTNADGHTPLPVDIANTLVVTASESSDNYTEYYSYKVTCSKDGYTNSISNVTVDSSWYRSNPNSYSHTILLTLPINASPENHAPTLDQIGNKSVTSDSLLEFKVTAVDQEGDVLNYSAKGIPDGANFDNRSGVFTWTPTTNQTGNHTVTFEVTDGCLTDTEDITINVSGRDLTDSVKSYVNLSVLSNQVIPGETFTADILVDQSTPISGTQLDFVFNSSKTSVINVTEGELLKQSGAYTIFSSGSINNSAGTVKNIYGFILGTSNVSSPGTMATVNLTAGNRTGMAEFSLSNVLISDANSKSVPYTVTNATILIDTAPVMSTICCPKSVDEKSTLTFKVSAKDADCDRLTLSASGLPEGASFNKTSGNFTWTPAVGQAGVYTLTFEVSDGYLTDSGNVTVTVNKLNNPPVISSFEPLNGSSFSEGERIEISVNASDADGQALNYSIRIDGVAYSDGTEYVWETDYSSSGNHTIEVVVSDGMDEVKEQHTIYISECRPRWDVDENGIVNILDITSVSQKYGTAVSKPYPRYDINQDGVVNILDLTLVGNHFGEYVK